MDRDNKMLRLRPSAWLQFVRKHWVFTSVAVVSGWVALFSDLSAMLTLLLENRDIIIGAPNDPWLRWIFVLIAFGFLGWGVWRSGAKDEENQKLISDAATREAEAQRAAADRLRNEVEPMHDMVRSYIEMHKYRVAAFEADETSKLIEEYKTKIDQYEALKPMIIHTSHISDPHARGIFTKLSGLIMLTNADTSAKPTTTKEPQLQFSPISQDEVAMHGGGRMRFDPMLNAGWFEYHRDNLKIFNHALLKIRQKITQDQSAAFAKADKVLGAKSG